MEKGVIHIVDDCLSPGGHSLDDGRQVGQQFDVNPDDVAVPAADQLPQAIDICSRDPTLWIGLACRQRLHIFVVKKGMMLDLDPGLAKPRQILEQPLACTCRLPGISRESRDAHQ